MYFVEYTICGLRINKMLIKRKKLDENERQGIIRKVFDYFRNTK